MRTLPFVLPLVLALAACGRSRGSGPGGAEEVTPRTRRIAVRDVGLHTVEVSRSRGPLRLVIHGGPGLDHTYLRPWMDRLGQTARLVYVDLRGHGRSTLPPDANGYTINAAAADLADLIAVLGEGQPADVIGHAFGAAVVLQLAGRHPERVRKIVLVDPMRDAGQIRAMPRLTQDTLGAEGFRRIMELTTPEGTLKRPDQTGELFRRLGRMWWHRPPSDEVISRMTRDMIYRPEADAHFLIDSAKWDGRGLATEVRAAALVVSGSSDHTFPAVQSRELAEMLPHGRYSEIPEAGHCPFIEQPERFATVVERFLAVNGRAE